MLRNSYFFIFSFFTFCTSVKDNTEANCKEYFPGKWKYDKYPTSTIYVIRTIEKQFEYTQDGKYYYEYEINWLSDCRYQMIYLSTSNPNMLNRNIGDTIAVEIDNARTRSMSYKTTFKNKIDSGSMTKIN